ncbi:Uncharacterized protein APZ42_009121, partial [Daphnia magna]
LSSTSITLFHTKIHTTTFTLLIWKKKLCATAYAGAEGLRCTEDQLLQQQHSTHPLNQINQLNHHDFIFIHHVSLVQNVF